MTPERTAAAGPASPRRPGAVLGAGGLIAAALGLLVATGWLVGAGRVTRFLPAADPMPFNAALALAVAGLGVLAAGLGPNRVGRGAGLLLALYGAVTLLEHLVEGRFGAGTLILVSPELDRAEFRGLAAPNTGLAFLLLGAAIVVLHQVRRPLSDLGVALLGAALVLLAGTDLAAYPGARSLSHPPAVLPQMSIPAALGFLVLGGALLYTGVTDDQGPVRVAAWRLPFALGVLGLSAAVGLAQVLRRQERQHIRRTMDVAAQSVARHIDDEVERRVASARAAAAAWAWLAPAGQERLARAAVAGLPATRGLGWLGRDGSRRWVVAPPADHDWWPSPHAGASQGRADTPDVVLDLRGGDPRLGLVVPVEPGGPGGRGAPGALWLVSDASLALRIGLHDVLDRFAVAIRDGATPVFVKAWRAEDLERWWASEAEVTAAGLRWNVRVWPLPEVLDRARSMTPMFTQMTGVAVAVLLALTLALTRAARARAVEAEAAHARLRAEVREREAAEQALRDSEERLRQAQRLEAVGRLAGGIAHDYNNLLTVIRGNARSLLRQSHLAPLERDALEHIERAAARAAVLTARLLAFSQRQVLQPEPLDLNDLIAGLEDAIAHLLGPRVRLVLERDREPVWVRVDRRWLSQVVLDLADNARDAMPLGGVLTIRVRRDGRAAQERYPQAVPDGEVVLLEVEDSGRGMDEETLRRLFEPFFSTKPFGQGSGLALASAYGLVRQSGGEIAIASEPGRGTRVGIFLPASGPPAPPEAEPERLAGKVVVAADDEPGVLRFLVWVLEGAGCRVVAGSTAEAALAQLGETGLVPDILVTDIVMPGMSGIELADRLREGRPDLPVLLVSAYTSEALRERGIESLGAFLLPKPFTGEELLEQVTRALARR
ncbi:MAG TPA: ATP-binding protein [Gemmatimonadales bacterium]|nr:ATP-binding protein [Gemmatimonadales bacterium]